MSHATAPAVEPVAAPHGPSVGTARLWLPRMSLAHCMRGFVVRDTRAVALPSEQRVNYFPAIPHCTLSWFFTGTAQLRTFAADGAPHGPALPMPGRLVLCGPQTRPLVSSNPGPVHCLMLGLMPDAVALLTGINVNSLIDTIVDARDVLDAEWLALCDSLFELAHDEQRIACIERFLEPRWQAVRPGRTRAAHVLEDWSDGLALRAANSGLGRSLRQIERRIKQWTGQPLRELRGYGRLERAFFDVVLAQEAGDVNWGDVACGAGFADQSHLCRQTRRITGFSPEELRRRIAQEEGFWVYRIWGFGESGPSAQAAHYSLRA